MTDAGQPAAGWYPDPTGRHGQRWWDGRQWTVHVADGQAVASDPVSVVVDVMEASGGVADAEEAALQRAAADDAHRSDIEGAVRCSDDGCLPAGWPERYEPVVAAVVDAMGADEIVHRAWRIRTTGPRQRVSDVGVLAVTDRQVIGADRSAKSSGIFCIPRADVATVALVHRYHGNSDFGYEIRLLGADGRVLGSEDSPAEFQVFDKGRDPSKWDSHPQGEDQLQEVQNALIWRIPGATAVRSDVELAPTRTTAEPADDHLDHPSPTAGAAVPMHRQVVGDGDRSGHEGQTGGAGETASAGEEVDDAEAQPMSVGSAIGSLVIGVLVLAVIGFFVADMMSSDCEREGIAMICTSTGGSVRVETEYNLLLIGAGAVFALLGVARGIVGLAANAAARTGRT